MPRRGGARSPLITDAQLEREQLALEAKFRAEVHALRQQLTQLGPYQASPAPQLWMQEAASLVSELERSVESYARLMLEAWIACLARNPHLRVRKRRGPKPTPRLVPSVLDDGAAPARRRGRPRTHTLTDDELIALVEDRQRGRRLTDRHAIAELLRDGAPSAIRSRIDACVADCLSEASSPFESRQALPHAIRQVEQQFELDGRHDEGPRLDLWVKRLSNAKQKRAAATTSRARRRRS